MQKYLLLIVTVSVLAGCSTTPEYVDSAQYCYTTENITVQDKQTVNSQTKVECSDKPRAEHFVKNHGIAKECTNYEQLVSIGKKQRKIKGFMCKFPDGTWEAVDGRYAYFN